MATATPQSLRIFYSLTLLLSSATYAAVSRAGAAAKFDNLSVHELIISSAHRQQPPHPSSHHINAAKRSANILSLKLYRRHSAAGKSNSGHRHRVTDLILRDHRRIAALLHRLSPYYRTDDFGSGVVPGLAQGSGEYFVRVGVGSPPKQQFMVVDSGSDLIWVQCQPCGQCYPQPDPIFDPALSASFSGVPCSSPVCALLSSGHSDSAASCSSGRCRYQVSYGDGSYTRGTLALETLTFDDAVVNNVAMGCGHRNRGLFVGAAGILGLGWGPLSFVGQLGGLAGGVFAYCLPGDGASGGLVFGRSAAVPEGAVWVPLLRNARAPSFYYVGLAGLGVGGERLAVAEEEFQMTEDGDGGTVMDTGTAVTRLPAAAYSALRDGYVAAAAGLPRAPGVSIFDTCYALAGYGSVRVPTVAFYFSGGAELTLPARNFLIPVDNGGTFCFAFAPSSSELAIIGNIQQEGIQITVDSANGFLGFGPTTC
ncbi:Protein aspartic protease in guard cell 2 [Apostasia shenzhenica]|uniref:Protein aspartic protease in guard cell 2 n=1 Tax=Apostasia shenzhenica TaxID=1088818 RepID=A0A2I0BBL9_9ASPA|nr:Protein aspartic protease in guard cell 2 [Apostasia shenzhenica]